MDHVALLSALPRTYEEIVAGATDRSKDYIRTQVLRNLNTPESAWATLGPLLKDRADTVFAWCHHARVRVEERAGLRELADALARHEIVILLAHWKGPHLHPKDLPETVEEIAKVGQILGLGETILEGATARTAPYAMQAALDDRIASWVEWLDISALGAGDIVVSDYYGRCLAREDMDAAVARSACSIVPGARLELCDGLWSARDIASCFPEEWRGVCDFVCCRSLYLSDVVKSHTRAGLVRTDARNLQPERVLDAVSRILQAVAEGKPYHSAAYSMEEDAE